jgi:ABC-type uncharacterized transport system ATPase subunit
METLVYLKYVKLYEQFNLDIDPYGEENWNEKPIEKEYKNWNGYLSDFIRQLKVEDVNDFLNKMDGSKRKDGEKIIVDILSYLKYEDEPPYLTKEQFKQIENNIYDLLDELCEPEEDEGPDPDFLYDLWRDRNLD